MTGFDESVDKVAYITGQPFVRKLDTVGDGSGSTSQNVDGSSTPVVFKIAPSAGQVFKIARMILYINDNASMDSGGWGALGGSPLTNGCVLGRYFNGAEHQVFSVKSNGEMASTCYDLNEKKFGSGNEYIVARLSFNKFTEEGVVLDGDNGDYLYFTINDNLGGLVEQYVTVQGEMFV